MQTTPKIKLAVAIKEPLLKACSECLVSVDGVAPHASKVSGRNFIVLKMTFLNGINEGKPVRHYVLLGSPSMWVFGSMNSPLEIIGREFLADCNMDTFDGRVYPRIRLHPKGWWSPLV